MLQGQRLDKVDLPQPDGPMTERNSPGLTLNDTSSTAVTGPSGGVEAHNDIVHHQDGIIGCADGWPRHSLLRVIAAVVAAV